MSPEPRLTIAEFAELFRREQAERGVTPAEVMRSSRADLERLRAAQGPEPVNSAEKPAEPQGPGLAARVAALEEEVKRLRDRIEGKNG
jgi:hypothetical protein